MVDVLMEMQNDDKTKYLDMVSLANILKEKGFTAANIGWMNRLDRIGALRKKYRQQRAMARFNELQKNGDAATAQKWIASRGKIASSVYGRVEKHVMSRDEWEKTHAQEHLSTGYEKNLAQRDELERELAENQIKLREILSTGVNMLSPEARKQKITIDETQRKLNFVNDIIADEENSRK